MLDFWPLLKEKSEIHEGSRYCCNQGSVQSRKFCESVERDRQALAAVKRAHNYAHYHGFPLTVFSPVALRRIISPGPDSNSELTFSGVFPMSLSDAVTDPTP